MVKHNLIILDELSYAPFSKVERCCCSESSVERMSLIVTTDLPFVHWAEVDEERVPNRYHAKLSGPPRADHLSQWRKLPP